MIIVGPELPFGLACHSMVPIGTEQAIIGGKGGQKDKNKEEQKKIYRIACASVKCTIIEMSQELSIPKRMFVAMPIPNEISGCPSL